MANPQQITFGEMRTSGVRDVLVYCRDYRCSYHVETSAEGCADDVMKFVCQVCGRRGADVRSKFPQARMGTG